ncbi:MULTISPECIES: GNAT family N-acetyltransferase [unclassified Sphingopyxis]|jgi:GNAT superfamily N-acetyltransferase|uniref:GNAT family N-acetyltransferase n=1 Tax=unclassified Sphingopyxis TaxID=2614943 RepID=UPI0006C0F3A6|nr:MULTISPECIES: GNAT family N-acetyltransferase [unclassified Sphingopyxis]USI76890.1 GNAT family N-acetyltransferase [Sphingopyxis sp. USTB-05]GAO80669.1 histone acetyltransferase HPA2 and related acetyltransferases [Sphingopyxis sp. C-1]
MSETYRLSFDRSDMQLGAIHAFLTKSYWAENIAPATVERAIEGSLCVGVFAPGGDQVGFARVVTDRATFAYLADVYVLDAHRGNGLAARMVTALHDHPDLQGLRRWMLATSDAHGLYAALGWTAIEDRAPFMQRHFPNIYRPA